MEQLPVRPSVLRSPQRRSVGRAAGVTFGGRDEIGRGVTRRRHQRHREGTKTGAETAATYVRRHRGIVAAFLPQKAEIKSARAQLSSKD